MIEQDRTDRTVVTKIVFYRSIVAVPGNDIQR